MPKLGVGISGEADFYYHRYEKGMRNMAWKTKDRYAKGHNRGSRFSEE